MRRRLALFVVASCAASAVLPARLRADGQLTLAPIRGVGPDLQVVGGGGVGLGHSLDNNFLGRMRLGALYASEPWLVAAGVTGEVGALAQLGFGGELELDHFDGEYAQLGAARAQGGELTTHLAVGYTIVGVEWQQRYTNAGIDHALLGEVRVPLGLWWFFVGHDKYKHDRQRQRAAMNARAGTAFAAAPTSTRLEPTPLPGSSPSADERFRAEKALERAHLESGQGHHALAAEALSQAYAIEPDPQILLLRADAELAQGKLVLATRDLQLFLQLTSSHADEPRRTEAQQRVRELSPRLAQLRLSCPDARGDELVRVDGASEPGALLGYDVPLDPGNHVLELRRGERELLWRELVAQPGQIVRLEVSCTQPAPPAPAAAPASEAHDH